VDADAMRRNLDLTGGLLLAEQVTVALAPSLGRLDAHELVQRASAEAVASRRPLAQVLSEQPKVTDLLGQEEIERLLDPAGYLGSTQAFIDRALRAHERAGRPPNEV
jgi:3-carboxy-cis,cis-muconate cycloisomerase